MANETTIPLLPCKSINDMLAFYNLLGFETTYQQKSPNVYAIVRRGDIELHFFQMRDFDPAQSYGSCIVGLQNVDALYAEFLAGIRKHYGKLLVSGIPRLTALRNKAGGIRGFNVIDPGGNWIRFAQQIENPQVDIISQDDEGIPEGTDATRLARAFHTARTLNDSKGDYKAAAKVLDVALAHHEPVPPILRVQALVLRAEVALLLGDQPFAQGLFGEVRQLALTDVERTVLADELQRIDELENQTP